jgi:two-component system, OmpR family, response regulator
MNAPPSPNPETLYVVSETGRQQLKGSSTRLSAAALRFLVLVDGKLSLGQIAKHLKNVPEKILGKIVFDLQQKGFIQALKSAEPGDSADLDELDFSSYQPPDPATAREQQDEDFALRLQEAQSFTAMLKQQGFVARIARQAVSTAKPASGGAYSVLVVEDSPTLLAAVRKFLELEGFLSRGAANRDEVAAELRKLPLPDLILLDVMLPGTSGFDILQRVRSHPMLKHIRVIMVTGMTARDDVMRALAADANGYITKPFKLDVLMKSIKAVLGLR